MKKLSFLLFALLLAMSAVSFAAEEADWMSQQLLAHGLSEADAEAFSALVMEIGADMTTEEREALLKDFLGESADSPASGTLEGDLYTSANGFTMRVPEGWKLLEDSLGAAAVLAGPVDDTGFMPTITTIVFDEARADFDTTTKENWDETLGGVLSNYQSVALDDFTFLDVPAHEFVCLHGDDIEAMLMQYQLYFNKGGKAFVITMTTLAEEAAHYSALDAYDTFLADFTVQGPGGQG